MPLATGDHLGPYEILGPLGAGGMGEVYKARDTRLGRIVAIKTSQARFSERFEREARAVAALNHPHICQLYDVGPNYLVMEFIDGVPLRGPLAPQEALRLALQIADALIEAHGAGILHRDLKPGNILVTARGAKLIDFGLAAQTGNSDATVTMAVMGTPVYMAPEQAEAKPLDQRSDIFGFGAVLYEMLSGTRPFRTIADVLREAPEPLAGAAAEIALRCLRKSPSERFQTMQEVKSALDRIVAKPIERQPSIAVLPFANLSGDKEQEYFSDGLTEEIINALAQIPGLKVTARTSAFAFRGKEQDIRKIAEALDVRAILEGSVRRSGNRIRMTAQLIDAQDGYHLWSQRYDREMADIFEIQDEISQAIADVLQTKLARHAPAQRLPANAEAYQAYLEGRHYMHQVTPQAMDRALECFEHAIALDPGYALPHTGLAFRAYYQVFYLGQSSRKVVPGALVSLAKALQLDPECSEVYMVRGMLAALYDYDWQGADRYFARGLELDPQSARVRTGRTLWFLSPTGRLEEALTEISYAASVDPLSPPVRNTELWVLHNLRKEEAPRRARELLQLFPSHLMIHWVACLTFLARDLIDEAIGTLENGLRVVPAHVHLLGLLAFARARQGRIADAREIRAELESRAAAQYVPCCALAWAHEACGDMDRAYKLLDQAIEDREALVVPVLADRREELGGEPRYRALLRKMNLT